LTLCKKKCRVPCPRPILFHGLAWVRPPRYIARFFLLLRAPSASCAPAEGHQGIIHARVLSLQISNAEPCSLPVRRPKELLLCFLRFALLVVTAGVFFLHHREFFYFPSVVIFFPPSLFSFRLFFLRARVLSASRCGFLFFSGRAAG